MRMLDTTTREFVEVNESQGQYSILSHRWEIGEVSFEDYSLTLHPAEYLLEREAVQVREIKSRQQRRTYGSNQWDVVIVRTCRRMLCLPYGRTTVAT